jgi:hypothetical protein
LTVCHGVTDEHSRFESCRHQRGQLPQHASEHRLIGRAEDEAQARIDDVRDHLPGLTEKRA